MKKILSLTAFVLPVAVTIPILAQECSHCCTGHTGEYEIFLQVEVTVPVSVKNLETGSFAWNAPVTPTFHPLGNCNWIATTQGTPGADAFLDDNTPYEIKIGNNVFTYFDCEGYNTTTEGFYCPNTLSGYKDLFLYHRSSGHTEVIPERLKDKGDYRAEFIDDYWLLPHNSDSFCGSDSSCQTQADELGIFMTPQVGANIYTMTNKDLKVRTGKAWDFYGQTLKFQSGKKFNVFGTLDLENTTLTASGTSWNGLYFGSGSSGSVASSSILKVGGGGGNSALTLWGSQPTISYSTIETNSGSYVFGFRRLDPFLGRLSGTVISRLVPLRPYT